MEDKSFTDLKFTLDVHLGKLAKLLGSLVLIHFLTDYNDAEIIIVFAAEERNYPYPG